MRFKRIYIEITNTCNLHCSFCIQNSRNPQIMTLHEFAHILDEVHPYSNYLYLHILGEPLSHPNLDEFLTLALQKGFQVNITTNGTLLRKSYDILKRHAIRQINVSIHSFPQHEQKGYLEDVFQVCEKLAAEEIYINYRLWSLHEDEMDDVTAALLQAILHRYQLTFDKNAIHRLQRLPLIDHISLHFEDVFTWPSLSQPYVNETGRCLGMKDMCGILVNGDVVPCCLDSKGECVLGNIYKDSFKDILESQRVMRMITDFAQHHVSEELCRHCTYRLRFSKERAK